jgi:hypothetical protein
MTDVILDTIWRRKCGQLRFEIFFVSARHMYPQLYKYFGILTTVPAKMAGK